MLTFFTIPKSFEGKIKLLQKNAILSWKRLKPSPEIILFGDEKGVAEFAKENSLLHFPEIKKNRWGTPLLGFAFEKAQEIAQTDLLVYSNCDLIFESEFPKLLNLIPFSKFLLTARRWDLKIEDEILIEENWERELKEKIKREGKLHGFSGMDWCLFPKKLSLKLPPFAVGRPGWDNWLLYQLKKKKIPIIDGTFTLLVIHQVHPSKYRARDEEAKENIRLAGGLSQMLTLREADWVLTSKGLKKPKIFRRIWANLALLSPVRLLLALKRYFFY